MLDVINLDFDYPEKRVLQNVHFTVNSGRLLHLRGANGAGKTTLLKLLAGMLYPTQGDIQYQGSSIKKNTSNYQQDMCFVGHKSGISQLLTVRENCRFELHKGRSGLTFDELIKRCALDGLEDMVCGFLSTGQRRRVGLLRLLMSDAKLWLLDEPLVGLDKDSIALFTASLNHHLQQGGLAILTSHQPLALHQENIQEYCL